jgi:hypothetical protein
MQQELSQKSGIIKQQSSIGALASDAENKRLEKELAKKFLKFEQKKSFFDLPWFPEAEYIYHDDHHNVEVEYNLTLVQRVFVMMEHHDSSKLGAIIAAIITLCIIVGCICFIMSEEPEFRDHHAVACASDKDVTCDHAGFSYLSCPVEKSSSYYGSSRRLAGSYEYI